MNIYEYYLEKNKDLKWVTNFQSTSDKYQGKNYWFLNTNYRRLKSFKDTFLKFKKLMGKPISSWDLNKEGQLKAKQWTVRMQQSKLYMRDGEQYFLTEKGKVFDDALSWTFSENDIWFITYILLLNGYFNNKPNYIFDRTKYIFSVFDGEGIKKEVLDKSIFSLISKDIEHVSFEDLIYYSSFWYFTFVEDNDFIYLYKISDESDKKALCSYVISERAKKPETSDCIAHKYCNSGQYLPSTMIEEQRIFYLAELIMNKEYDGSSDFLAKAINACSTFLKIDSDRIKIFFMNHKNVLDVIYKDIFGIVEEEDDSVIEDEKVTEGKIDDTDNNNDDKIRKTREILKNMCRKKAGDKCELEKLNNCKYFKSKATNDNYLEVHHLIPFEFSNDFGYSIEILENYVALCPYCHKLLHYGLDSERKICLNYLYNERIDGLRKKHIDISLKQLLDYYGVKD